MARTSVRSRRVAVLVTVLVGTLWAVGGAAGDARPQPRRSDRYVVRPDDTLWELARRRVGPEGDPRPMVEAIRRANGLVGSEVAAGQGLVLP